MTQYCLQLDIHMWKKGSSCQFHGIEDLIIEIDH